MKRLALLFFLCVSALGAQTQITRIDLLSLYAPGMDQPARPAKAPLAVASAHLSLKETVTDLGFLPAQKATGRELVFRNSGQQILFVRAAIPSCGSAVEVVSLETAIPPGGQGLCKVRITPEKKGPFAYYLAIYTNADNFVEVICLTGSGL